MALRIFDTDPDARPKERQAVDYANEFAFHFRSGIQIDGKPRSLPAWRVTTGRPKTAEAIALLMGGASAEYDASKEENLHVLTEADSVEVVIDGSHAIEDKMILWGPRGPVHECDGVSFLSPAEERGNPCGCPTTLKARKAKAKNGTGPSPAINIKFRLAADYDLGQGKLMSQAWTLATVIHEVKNALDAVGEPALCALELERVQYTDAATGEARDFRKPVIRVLGSYNSAIAEDPV